MLRAMRLAITALLIAVACTACSRLVLGGYSAAPEALRAGAYELDKAHASLLFRINHLGLSDYAGRFNSFDARLDYAADGSAHARLHAVIDMSSIDVNNRPFEETLRGPDWLDSARFPQAVLEVDGLPERSGDRLVYSGVLRWRGIEAPVLLRVHFRAAAENRLTRRYTLGFAATTTLSRSAFGVSRFSGMVGDEVQFEINAEFQRKEN